MTYVRRLLAAALCVCACLTPLLPAHAGPAAQRAVRLSAEIGFDSYVRTERWTELRLTIENAGPAFSGSAEVRSAARVVEEVFLRPLTVGENATRRATLTLPGDLDSYEVLLRDAAGAVVASATPNVRRLDDRDRLIVVVSDPPDALNFLGALPAPFADGGSSLVAPSSITDLPALGPALDAADVIVFRAVDTSALGADQVRALRSWVLAGGHLVLVGGPSAAATHAGLNDLAPAAPGAPLFVPLPSLAAFARADALAAPAPATTLTALHAEADVLAAAPQSPLVVRRRIGSGVVDALAFDPALEPLRSWPGTLPLLHRLLRARPSATGGALRIVNADDAVAAATSMPAPDIPSPLTALAWLAAYALVLGPLNLFALRKLKRLQLAWITAPAITVVFVVTALVGGVPFIGNPPLMQRLTVRLAHAGEPTARTAALIGLWSPRAAPHTVAAQSTALRELAARRTGDEPIIDAVAVADAIGIPNLTLGVRPRALFVQGDDDAPAALFGSAEFVADASPYVQATLTNRAANDLRDCTLLIGRDYHAIGDIPAGATVQAQATLYVDHPQLAFGMTDDAQRAASPYDGKRVGALTDASPARSDRAPAEPAPFDRNGAPPVDALANWIDYRGNRQRHEARVGLLLALLDQQRGAFGDAPGAAVACWSDEPIVDATIAGALAFDQTLTLHRLPAAPHVVDRPQTLPADLYALALVGATSRIASARDGLTLTPGEHELSFEPWIPVRRTSAVRASAAVALRIEAEQRTDVRATATISAWNWANARFDEIAPDLAALDRLPTLGDDYLSPTGELRLLLRVTGGRITVQRAAPTVRFTP